MDEVYWLGIIWVVFLTTDLISSAAKSAFNHVRLPWLIGLAAENQAKVDKTINLIEKQGLRTALRLSVILSHFMLAGFTVLFFNQLLTAKG
ncbi:MAG: hypothetical protein KBA03_04065, partial [Anaerolineaceae bacterium]|nr:hypothetical protein [Anaerolineaceae bacterium]